jgi:hypothetical protein
MAKSRREVQMIEIREVTPRNIADFYVGLSHRRTSMSG